MWVLVSVINNCVTSLGNDLLWIDEGLKVGIIFGIRNQLNCIHKNESKRDVQLHAMVIKKLRPDFLSCLFHRGHCCMRH